MKNALEIVPVSRMDEVLTHALAHAPTPIRWDEVDTAEPGDLTIATVPARFAELGDLHAGIDEAVFVLDELLEWADRDAAEGAGAPPEEEAQDLDA